MARILILVENLSVPFDRRVWQESRALVEAGHEVTVICPRGTKRDTEPYARIEGVEIHRYALEAATGGPAGYLQASTARRSGSRCGSRASSTASGPFDVIQACNPPDLLFLVALPFKLRGARFVFDHHDLVPELFRSRFGAGGPLLWATELLERVDVPARRSRDLDERELPQRRARRAVASRPSARRWCAARPTSRASCRSRPTTRCGAAARTSSATSA